jgi:Dyp-type peroxidase family
VPELQEGIGYAKWTRPGAFFGIVFLQAAPELDAAKLGELLGALWQMYDGLKAGRVRDLDPEVVPHERDKLRVLLGLGPNTFDLAGVRETAPAGFADSRFRSPQGHGGPLLPGAGLHYAPDVDANPATEHVCVQLTAQTKLAVDRAIVETWKLLLDHVDPATGIAPLSVTSFYLGAQRSDRRSWIDFHDGLSNLAGPEREPVIVVKASNHDQPWCLGGTYLAFIRIAVDLPAWRRLPRRTQELLVGRDKLSGCPLTGVDDDGAPTTDRACPIGGAPIYDQVNDGRFAEPPAIVDREIGMSHVHRANHHDSLIDTPKSGRIYRQGYEFLEWQADAPGFRLGLNFVSFQDTPARLIRVLATGGWLGGVNFGGDPEAQPEGMTGLLRVYAAGIYFVPPRASPFPGASVFGIAATEGVPAPPTTTPATVEV